MSRVRSSDYDVVDVTLIFGTLEAKIRRKNHRTTWTCHNDYEKWFGSFLFSNCNSMPSQPQLSSGSCGSSESSGWENPLSQASPKNPTDPSHKLERISMGSSPNSSVRFQFQLYVALMNIYQRIPQSIIARILMASSIIQSFNSVNFYLWTSFANIRHGIAKASRKCSTFHARLEDFFFLFQVFREYFDDPWGFFWDFSTF